VVEHFVQMAIFAMVLGAIEKSDAEHYVFILILIVLYILYSPANFVLSRMLRVMYMRDTILDVRKQAFDKIINMPFKKYSRKSKEIYISNLINDVNTFERKFFYSLLNFLIGISMFLISMVLLIIMDLKLAVGMFAFSVLLYLLARMFTKKTTSLEQEISKTNEVFTTEISNTLNGIEILKLNNMEEKFLKKSITTVSRLERRKYLANVFTELQRSIIRILSYGASVVVMVYLGYRIQGVLNLAEAAFLY
jgi:ABC-type transport system involved in cytochrome bd biosynthesis fused ATPase/permease subunit